MFKQHTEQTRLLPRIWRFINIQILLPMLLVTVAPVANAIPVAISWDAPTAPGTVYRLEVTSDPGFANILVTQDVTGQSYAWDAPAEGVYHWRIGRSGDHTSGGVEQSSFASGSFIVLDHSAPRARPVKLSWQGAAVVAQYKLYVTGSSGISMTMVTSIPSIVFSEVRDSSSIVVAPFRGTGPERALQMDPSLTLDSGNPAPPLNPVALPPPPPASVVVEESTPTPPAPDVPSAKRAYDLYIGVDSGREDMTLNKLETGLSTNAPFSGGSIGLKINPQGGFAVRSHLSYHDLKSAESSLTEAKEESQSVHFARYAADIAVAYNFLEPFTLPAHSLLLGAAGSAIQLPFLSDDPFEAKLVSRLPVKQKQISAMGGYLGYSFQGRNVGFNIEGAYLWEESSDAVIFTERLILDYLISDRYIIGLLASYRREDAKFCSDDPALCLSHGKSATSTSVSEIGLLFGIGQF